MRTIHLAPGIDSGLATLIDTRCLVQEVRLRMLHLCTDACGDFDCPSEVPCDNAYHELQEIRKGGLIKSGPLDPVKAAHEAIDLAIDDHTPFVERLRREAHAALNAAVEDEADKHHRFIGGIGECPACHRSVKP